MFRGAKVWGKRETKEARYCSCRREKSRSFEPKEKAAGKIKKSFVGEDKLPQIHAKGGGG